MSSTESITLQASDLAIGYQSRHGTDKEIANGIDIQLPAAKFVCLLGPNGAGKSTLLRTLAGLQPPLAGSIDLGPKALTSLSHAERARSVSLVLTDPPPIGIFSVYSLVSLGRHPHTRWNGRLTPEDRQKVDWAIQSVDAQDLAHRFVAELSDGEKQKVMIARALAQEAPLMLLDEPTAYLDIPRRVDLMRTLRRLAHVEKLTILLSTHDLELALRSADELWLLSRSGVLTRGQPEDLALNGRIAEVFDSPNLDWDIEHGTFRVHQEPCLYVHLRGENAAYAWTTRALARLGYGLAEGDQNVAFSVHIQPIPSGHEWIVTREDKSHQLPSLEALCTWINDLGSHH